MSSHDDHDAGRRDRVLTPATAPKSARKSAPQPRSGLPAPGRPFAPGEDPRRGRGPAKGEGGRRPDAVKAALLDSFGDRRHLLEEIADDPTQDATVRLRALDLMARYAGLQSVQIQSDMRTILVDLPVPGGST